ncbi:hypothetical protein [uncultured Holdemanella sp.]|uniref:hypothetical protein n=1 Tax=uncultured Holdemanella sp. TaxID=1763549 RepID=UPI0025D39B9D|nr:hypothetical protein [uncultured Holdemanella sp.]
MYHASINKENNNHVLDDLKDENTIFKKVKLGVCYIFNENNNYADDDIAKSFYISFDEKTLNYHIVPEDRENTDYMYNILKSLKDKIKSNKLNNWEITYRGTPSKPIPGIVMGGSSKVTKGHKWIEIVFNQINFILEFQTLCFDGDKLNCYLDKIQFVAYPHFETLNYFSLNGDLHIMYPNKGDGNYCVGNNRVVYNTEFDCESNSEEVAESFIEFIKDILKDSSPKVYTHND